MDEADAAWTLVAILGAAFVAVLVLFLGIIVQVVIRLREHIDEVRHFLRFRCRRERARPGDSDDQGGN